MKIQPSLVTSSALRSAVFSAVLSLVAISTTSTAAGGQGPTEVQGVVEVLNDVLYTPYARVVSLPGNIIAGFDIPAGKRLIIETITFQSNHPTASPQRMFLDHVVPGSPSKAVVPLAIQDRIVEGETTWVLGTHSVKIRIDAVAGENSEILIRRGGIHAGALLVGVYGYLVDI